MNKQIVKPLPLDLQEVVRNNKIRTRVAFESHYWFFGLYLSHYIKYKSAPFHQGLFDLTEQEKHNFLVLVAFRGSAKSTIMTLSLPIWAILGKLEKKFIVIVGLTQRQARQHLYNIRQELESNELLKNDLGPFKEIEDEWGSYSIVIPKYNARITAVSMEQTIRGARHNQHRPDLIICDDIEDLGTVKTQEGRDKIYQWVMGEVIPAGDNNTKHIFIGNLLHEDSLLMRLKNKITDKKINGYFKRIPLIDDDNKISWLGKFKDQEAIDREKKKIGDEITWQREYMLKIVAEDGRVIQPDWIKYYDSLPNQNSKDEYRFSAIGIDLAISEKDTADYTAMVSASVYDYGKDVKIYILPNPINERMPHPKTVETAKNLSDNLNIDSKAKIIVEDVGYQKALVHDLERLNYPVEGMRVYGNKRDRLRSVSHLIHNGTILFPKQGVDLLINQIIGLGIEKHDDLADAFTLLINSIIEKSKESKHEFFIKPIYDNEDDDEFYDDE